MDPVALKPVDAAILLGISERTLQTWTASGFVPSIKRGGVRLYSVDALREWAKGASAYEEAQRGKTAKVGNGVGLSAPWGREVGRSGSRRQRPPRPIRLDEAGGGQDAG